MQFKPTSMAVAVAAAFATIPAAHALNLATTQGLLASGSAGSNVTYITGATAVTRAVFNTITQELCGSSIDVWKTGAAAAAPGNNLLISCTLANAAPVPAAVRGQNWVFNFALQGGSLTSVRGQSSTVALQNEFLTSALTGCDAAGSPGFTGVNTFGNCNGTVGTGLVAARSHGGFSDVESVIFSNIISGYTGLPAFQATAVTAGQAFGIAVNEPLYRALQQSQGITAADCRNDTFSTGTVVGTNDRAPACQPSISSQAYSSLINNLKNRAKQVATEIITVDGSGAAVPANATFSNIRRPDTSGTQASSNIFFLERPCSPLGQRIPATQGTLNNVQTLHASGSGDVRNALNGNASIATEPASDGNIVTANVTGTYRFGVLSAENRPGATDTYSYVKLDGLAINTEGTPVTSAQRQSLIDGNYNFGYELALHTNPTGFANSDALLKAIGTSLGNPTITNLTGIFVVRNGAFTNVTNPTQVAKGTRNGNSCSAWTW